MESTLIIIRGNSRSGKTTAAKTLQNQLGNGTLLVSQDVVRRDMLKVHDRDGNPSIDLIRQILKKSLIFSTPLVKQYRLLLFSSFIKFQVSPSPYLLLYPNSTKQKIC
ncbi:adenylate kinase family enzyme [Chryseomicrobium aureum]|nr:adenylate kinase family enzyme [Chryseomicrobium aureum]